MRISDFIQSMENSDNFSLSPVKKQIEETNPNVNTLY